MGNDAGHRLPRPFRRGQFPRALAAALGCAALLAGLGIWAAGASAVHHRGPVPRTAPGRRPASGSQRPNIVFVLTDDLSANLLRFMPAVQAMARRGLTFENYFVSDSLCCPSRSSIFTGNLPHDTGIFVNTGRHGGFDQFYGRGEEQHTFAVALRRAGYRTALMGKYLNGYMGGRGEPLITAPSYMPPGWTRWDVAGWGYPERAQAVEASLRACRRPSEAAPNRRVSIGDARRVRSLFVVRFAGSASWSGPAA